MKKLTLSPLLKHLACRISILAVGLAVAHPMLAQITVLSDFDDGIPDWNGEVDRFNLVTFAETGGRLVIEGLFPETDPLCHPQTTTGVWWNRNLQVLDATTVELRADLISANQNDVFAVLMYDRGGVGGYALMKDEDEIFLQKYRPRECLTAALFYENTPIKNENVRLVLALTGVGENVFITVKVIDNESTPNPVLFERTVIDTPGVDPTVTNFHGFVWGPDPGPPFKTSDGPVIGMQHYTDGTQGSAEVVFDNYVYEYKSAVELNIERAVRLSWPDFTTPFVVEGATSLDGPWIPINEPTLKTNAMNWMTVPAPLSTTLQVFRLQQAP